MGGNPETLTDPTGMRMLGPSGQTAWVNPDGTIYADTPTTGATVIGHNKYPLPSWSGIGSAPAKPVQKPHPRFNFNTAQGRIACYRDKACGTAMHHIAMNYFNEVVTPLIGVGTMVLETVLLLREWDLGGAVEADQLEIEEIVEKEQLLTEEDQATLEDWACSFTAPTKVSTQTGKEPIGSLKPGERVLAYNPKTRKMELQPIVHVWINHDNDLVDLTITTQQVSHGKAQKVTHEVIHTNKKHPFLTVEKGFLPVGQIKVGMHVVEADGQTGVISEWRVVPGVQTMYNLEVAHDHTFTVGAGQWVVHNCSQQFTTDAKILRQMPGRGWTKDSIQDALDNPDHVVPVKDIRGGINNPEPATAYFSKSGGYVVRNDATGDIVQVSNRNDPNWKGP